jgi:hypothetical protein
MSSGLQPGDHLFVFPLDFEILVSVGAKTLTLLHNDRFFKDYTTLDVRLIPGMRIPKGGRLDLTIKDTAAWVQGRRVIPTDPRFNDADKWLMSNRTGFNVRALPQAKPANPQETIIEPHKVLSAKAGKTAPKSPKATPKKKPAPKLAADRDDDTDDATAGVPETGVFLAREDIEELYTLIRNGTKMTLIR